VVRGGACAEGVKMRPYEVRGQGGRLRLRIEKHLGRIDVYVPNCGTYGAMLTPTEARATARKLMCLADEAEAFTVKERRAKRLVECVWSNYL
jgi:hypothetical protein